jgi:membrane-bound lytic murein transglycosylase D
MLMSVNKIPAGMRLKQGSTILIPKDDNDDEDISADVAENAKLAMEPDVPDTRKLLIRVNRNQTLAAVAQRYGVSVSQLQAWNRTQRHAVSRGQVLVLHVPNGRAIRLASHAPPARVQRISSHVEPRAPRYDSNKDRAKRGGGVVRVADHVGSDSAGSSSKTEKTSARTPTKAPPKSESSAGKTKVAAKSRAKPAAEAQKDNAK